jgi:hypothetical protein
MLQVDDIWWIFRPYIPQDATMECAATLCSIARSRGVPVEDSPLHKLALQDDRYWMEIYGENDREHFIYEMSVQGISAERRLDLLHLWDKQLVDFE